jgi:hypothetical protein
MRHTPRAFSPSRHENRQPALLGPNNRTSPTAGWPAAADAGGWPASGGLCLTLGHTDENLMASAPKSMLIVAGHAIWDGKDWKGIEKSKFPDPEAMKRTIAQHVRDGCKMGVKRLYDVIAFSGGQTRKNLELTEAQGMANFAAYRNIEFPDDLLFESFARDSFENVFLSLLAFYHNYKAWPETIGVISMPHKSIRFMLMATGLHFDNFTFHGIGKVDPHEKNCLNEMINMGVVIDYKTKTIKDPLLRAPHFVSKRVGRTGPCYDNNQSDDENKNKDDKYLRCAASAYGDDRLVEQVINCDRQGGWRKLRWPWQP